MPGGRACLPGCACGRHNRKLTPESLERMRANGRSGALLLTFEIRSRGGKASKAMTHGRYHTLAHKSWEMMKQRCFNPNSPNFYNYGGRGITVCDRWRDSFENFLADMGERPEGKTLDRIDVDGDYEPGNCRWATAKEQRANRRLRAV